MRGAWRPPLAGRAAPGVDAAPCAPCPAVWLVPFLPHPGEGAGDGAGGVGEKMSLGIRDQDGPGAVIFEGARGVDKPARAPVKGTLHMDGERERREIKALHARRIGQEELLPRALFGEHGMDLQHGALQRAGWTGHVGRQPGEEFALRLGDKPAQGGIRYPGIHAGGAYDVAIGVDHPIDRAPRIVIDKVSLPGLGSAQPSRQQQCQSDADREVTVLLRILLVELVSAVAGSLTVFLRRQTTW